MTSQYPDVNDVQFAGLLQVATAAADAQERNATALGKRKRDDEALIDHQLRSQQGEESHQHAQPMLPTLQSAAAVIFREPSEKSKKYSRPPLGKVFTDMELAPERFLKLQNAAKAFMLDSNYPERKAVVGQKKESSNNDVAKLKLWTCVEQFMDVDYNGEKYFGHSATSTNPNNPHRTFFWPEDKDRIVKLCMPLFRKMVTNERQRLYASESRKHDPSRADRGKRRTPGPPEDRNFGETTSITADGTTAIDVEQPSMDTGQDGWLTSSATNSRTAETSLTVYVNVVSKESGNKTRRIPRITVLSGETPSLVALYSIIQQHFDLTPYRQEGANGIPTLPCLQVLTEDALVHLYTDEDWSGVLQRTSRCEWLDNEVRVVLEL
jgi:hypothetical protein